MIRNVTFCTAWRTITRTGSAILNRIGGCFAYRGNTSTPQGPVPAFTFLVTVFVARFTTEISFEGPLAEYRVFASGESAMPQGRAPTATEPKTVFVAVSMVNTSCPLPVLA